MTSEYLSEFEAFLSMGKPEIMGITMRWKDYPACAKARIAKKRGNSIKREDWWVALVEYLGRRLYATELNAAGWMTRALDHPESA